MKKEYSISNQRKLFHELKQLLAYKEVFFALTWKNIRLQYDSFWLGIVWGIFNPIIMSIIFYVSFGKNIGTEYLNYFIFVYAGFLIWNFFSVSLSQSYTCFLNNSDLVKKVYFPRFLLPFSYLSSKLFDFIIGLFILLGILLSSLEVYWLSFLIHTLLAFICLVMTSSGFSLFFSVFTVRYKGFQAVFIIFSQAIFFTSSVIYDSNKLISKDMVQQLFQLNPLTGTMSIFRAGIYGEELSSMYYLLCILYSFVIFLVGLYWFHRENKYLVDRL